MRCEEWHLLLPYILGPPLPPMGTCIKGFPPSTKVNSKPPMEPPPEKGPAPPKGEGPPPLRLPPAAMPIFICILNMNRLRLARYVTMQDVCALGVQCCEARQREPAACRGMHACMLTTHICMKKEKASSISSSSMVNSSSDSDSGWVTFW